MIKLAVIAGPTASGKTALAVSLAKRFGGEIVSADSMQIYKHMNIATAKPTEKERKEVAHHLIDFLEPDEEFSVADYVTSARKVIADISLRGNLPIVCGGTGLYIDSLIKNITFAKAEAPESLRRELTELSKQKGGGYLLGVLREFDPETASKLHENNVKRIIRAIEIYKTTGITASEHNRLSTAEPSPYDAVEIVLDFRDRKILYERIDARVDKMFSDGLLEEAREILSDSSIKTARQAIGYKELAPYFSGEKTLEECADSLKLSTRRYAKRQLTWFRRSQNTVWLYPDDYSSPEGLFNAASSLLCNRFHLKDASN